MTTEDFIKKREQIISKDLETSENLMRHAFNQGYELGYQQHGKDFVEKGEKVYQKGLDDAWDAAKKIILPFDDCLKCEELEEIFGVNMGVHTILKTFSASEAIEKIREYIESR